jgi:hypothetical protein
MRFLWFIRQFFVWGILGVITGYLTTGICFAVWLAYTNLGLITTAMLFGTAAMIIGFIVVAIIEGNRPDFFKRHRRVNQNHIEHRHEHF